MTREEVADLLEVADKLWSHSNLVTGDLEQTIKTWHAVLEPLPASVVQDALVDMARTGREHAPGPGVVFATARLRSGPAPLSFDDMQKWLSRHMSFLPYVHEGDAHDTTLAIEILDRHGAHEATLRFVVQHGIEAIRRMPDPTLHPLDPGQQADRRDYARWYRQRTVPEWESDPTPGLALARSQAADARLVEREQVRQLPAG